MPKKETGAMGFIKRILRGIFMTLLVLSPLLYWMGSEVYYAFSIQPTDVVTIADYYRHFPAPSSVNRVECGGIHYYQLRGQGPGTFCWAVPSGSPLYIFNESGRLVDWNPDPGDTPYVSKKEYKFIEKADPISFEKEFGVRH